MAHEALPTPFAEAVLDLVGSIPAGSVMAYSDVAAVLGRGGARQVGQALARFGGGVPWWRVVRVDGSCAAGLAAEQLRKLHAEKVPMVGADSTSRSRHIDMDHARWTPPDGWRQ
jgi:alkylated DNA nucleotide flippase Atl1